MGLIFTASMLWLTISLISVYGTKCPYVGLDIWLAKFELLSRLKVKLQKDLAIKNVLTKIRLTTGQTEFFASLLEAGSAKRKEYILTAGDICRYQWFVVSGCLKVSYMDSMGLEHIMKFAPENWWTLDLDSFENQSPAFYTVQALEDTRFLMLSRTNYQLLLDTVPEFQKFYRLMYQSSLIELARRMSQNLSMKAEERYMQFLETYPGLQLRISQKLIAAYLGVTPEYFSVMKRRELTQLNAC